MADPNYVPKLWRIASITNAKVPTVVTTGVHGYFTGQTVMVMVPRNYGMHIDYVESRITVTGPISFTVNIDTSGMSPFVIPAAPRTAAHCCPVSGTTDNIA